MLLAWYAACFVFAVALAVIAWLSEVICLLVAVAAIVGLTVHTIRPFAAATLFALPPLGPMLLGAATAVPQWADGRAGRAAHGQTVFGMTNLDRVARFHPRQSLGCLVSPMDVAVDGAFDIGHNGTLWLLGTELGPPKGAYTGPIPTEAELVEAFVTGSVRVGVDVDQGVARLSDGTEIAIAPPREFLHLAGGFSPAAVVAEQWIAGLSIDGTLVVWARASGEPVVRYRSSDPRLHRVVTTAFIRP